VDHTRDVLFNFIAHALSRGVDSGIGTSAAHVATVMLVVVVLRLCAQTRAYGSSLYAMVVAVVLVLAATCAISSICAHGTTGGVAGFASGALCHLVLGGTCSHQ
jgi:hypothetical protein